MADLGSAFVFEAHEPHSAGWLIFLAHVIPLLNREFNAEKILLN